MKYSVIILVLFGLGCSTPIDYEAEKTAITQLIDEETRYAAAGDLDNWSSCWIVSGEPVFHFTDATGSGSWTLNEVSDQMSDSETFDLQINRDNYNFVIGEDEAFVSFDQEDNWGGEKRTTRENRTLKKVNGEWKIATATVLVKSSFVEPDYESFHMAYDQIPPNPASGFTNVYGKGGMSIGYLNVPGPMDFSPLFVGLPEDMCNSPHWGIVLEGSIDLIYEDGKEETIKAGEVFYMPAPHTAKVSKKLEMVDFSPDPEFMALMDHIVERQKELAEN